MKDKSGMWEDIVSVNVLTKLEDVSVDHNLTTSLLRIVINNFCCNGKLL